MFTLSRISTHSWHTSVSFHASSHRINCGSSKLLHMLFDRNMGPHISMCALVSLKHDRFNMKLAYNGTKVNTIYPHKQKADTTASLIGCQEDTNNCTQASLVFNPRSYLQLLTKTWGYRSITLAQQQNFDRIMSWQKHWLLQLHVHCLFNGYIHLYENNYIIIIIDSYLISYGYDYRQCMHELYLAIKLGYNMISMTS